MKSCGGGGGGEVVDQKRQVRHDAQPVEQNHDDHGGDGAHDRFPPVSVESIAASSEFAPCRRGPVVLVTWTSGLGRSASGRARVSSIMDSTARSWAAVRFWPRTAPTTRSRAALLSSSADRVAVMPADNWVLSLVMWLAGSVLVRVAAHRRPLSTQVVAGVVERMGVSVSRWAHVCRSDLSGWPWVCCRGVFAGSTVLDGRVLSTRWCPAGCEGVVASVDLPASLGNVGDSFGAVAASLPRCTGAGQPGRRRPRGWAQTGRPIDFRWVRLCRCSTDASVSGNTSASCPSSQ
jgi:hypothetical protein